MTFGTDPAGSWGQQLPATDVCSCLCQNFTCSWREEPESPFSLNIYEVPETSGCLAQESWPALFKCPAAQGWPSGRLSRA